jgi:hypothetical protein
LSGKGGGGIYIGDNVNANLFPSSPLFNINYTNFLKCFCEEENSHGGAIYLNMSGYKKGEMKHVVFERNEVCCLCRLYG